MDRVDVAFDPSPAPERIGLGLSSGTVALAQRSSPTVASAKSRSAGRDSRGRACSRNRDGWSIDECVEGGREAPPPCVARWIGPRTAASIDVDLETDRGAHQVHSR
ncbi:hypothetical protein BDA96_10G236400 [Sorghum bicolor]|jgi:hypothetical protein|uniref:Uncharacterized protein n=2 Tax=Sorghum bicolor TaxID=4558 RepID=A0A921Q615_SORBI|nr:hypothetical protein BDA96_10G236400 [Sorghum bicolor]OQU76649.1 hypothetical protein SORBI_3010G179850 [Sorghum bicolor]